MPVMNCPKCSAIVPVGPLTAKCTNCGWDSSDDDLNDLVSDPGELRAEIRAGVQEGFADALRPRGGKRESHKQALRQLLDRYGVQEITDRTREQLIDEIIRVHERFQESPSWLNEALNSGDGTYKP